MQANDFNPWLETAVATVLESMCFFSTVGEAAEDTVLELPQAWVGGKLNFRGVPSGTFGISFPAHTARTLAANFLGEDEPEIDEAQTSEAVCELANMMCGALLTRQEAKRTFDLSSPVPCRPDESTGVANRIERTFLLEEGVIRVWLEIAGAA
jgi:CheY-specific phosphatase CheX